MTESDPILAARKLKCRNEIGMCTRPSATTGSRSRLIWQSIRRILNASDQGAGLTSANGQELIACGFKTQSTTRRILR